MPALRIFVGILKIVCSLHESIFREVEHDIVDRLHYWLVLLLLLDDDNDDGSIFAKIRIATHGSICSIVSMSGP